MWFHQRTGPNSGVSFGVGTLLLLGFVAVGLIGMAGPVWVFAVLVCGGLGAALWLIIVSEAHRQHQDRFAPGCRYCDRELAELRAREQQDLADTEHARLREQYGDR